MIDEQSMMLAVDMTGDRTVAGWLASEKMNGCRAYWDGAQFWTRSGRVIPAPEWFTRGLPGIHLDGEIWAGRGSGSGNRNTGFLAASQAVRLGGHWFDEPGLEFVAFDAPQVAGNWLRRMAEARRAVRGCAAARAVSVTRIGDIAHFVRYLTTLRQAGAEGAMFRNPETDAYECGRSANLLRFKYCQ